MLYSTQTETQEDVVFPLYLIYPRPVVEKTLTYIRTIGIKIGR